MTTHFDATHPNFAPWRLTVLPREHYDAVREAKPSFGIIVDEKSELPGEDQARSR